MVLERKLFESTARTPKIDFDPYTGKFELTGRSIPENAKQIYEPLINKWMDEYLKSPAQETVATIFLEYFNTSTSMWLFHLFNKFVQLHENNHPVQVNWQYSDEDGFDAGYDYQRIFEKIPFNLVNINEIK